MDMPKVSIIGAGMVGGAAAQAIATRGLADVVLVDVLGDQTKGKGVDLAQSMAAVGVDTSVVGTDDFSQIKGSEIVVITAGKPRQPDMTREDLIDVNCKILKSVCEQVKQYAPDAIIIPVSNPLDLITAAAARYLDVDKKKILGMGGQLDCLRFAQKIKKRIKVSYKDIQTTVVGMHGKDMVPLPEYSTIKGITLPDMLSPQEIEDVVEETKNGGAEIVDLLKSGSAYYAPGESIRIMVEAILTDSHKIVCSCVFSEDDGVFLGRPVMLGKEGVHKIVTLKLNDDDKKSFTSAIATVKELAKEII
jgi:malate dehydrogenase